jgi:hypothetical protein
MKYVAIINTPGYLPEAEPAVFDTPQEAWSHLADERQRHEEEAEPESEVYSDTFADLAALGTEAHWRHRHHAQWLTDSGLAADGTGSIVGPTPGYEGSHDLGLAYTVTVDGA